MHKRPLDSEANLQERVLARVMAVDLRRIQGRALSPWIESTVTGETRKDWSDPEFEGAPAV